MSTHRTVHAATVAIQLAEVRGSFRLPDLRSKLEEDGDDVPANSTLRLVLRQLEESNWLRREHPEGRIWYAGEKTTSE